MPDVRKCAVVIDKWKLKYFRRVFKISNFDFEETKGVTPDTLLLKVFTDDVNALSVAVYEANRRAFIATDKRFN